MTESYSERFKYNESRSKTSKQRCGDLFYDWWGEMWVKKSSSTAKEYSGNFGIEELKKELKNKFSHSIIVDKIDKSIDPLKECMTSEWTCLTWDNKMYAYFKTEEDKVKFILFST